MNIMALRIASLSALEALFMHNIFYTTATRWSVSHINPAGVEIWEISLIVWIHQGGEGHIARMREKKIQSFGS
jgi:hypothetical protein